MIPANRQENVAVFQPYMKTDEPLSKEKTIAASVRAPATAAKNNTRSQLRPTKNANAFEPETKALMIASYLQSSQSYEWIWAKKGRAVDRFLSAIRPSTLCHWS